MLNELTSRALLDGVRGKAPIDRPALANMISAVSCFGAAAGNRLSELDLNPVFVRTRRRRGGDWVMVLNGSE